MKAIWFARTLPILLLSAGVAQQLPTYTSATNTGRGTRLTYVAIVPDEAKSTTDPLKTETFEQTRSKAEKGDAEAQLRLAGMYAVGNGVTQDFGQFARWVRKAAEQGFPLAQYGLGICYEGGFGVTQDLAEAAKWYRRSAEQGLDCAQYSLALCYSKGSGVPKDTVEAVKWLRKAAEQGEAEAQFHLGGCYANAQGVPKDSHEALNWYRRAAEQGEVQAQFLLGRCYAQTLLGQTQVLLEGVPQDYAQAVKWFQRAANQGDVGAQIGLGGCYWEGRGVPKNRIEAYRWLNLASAQNPAGVAKSLVEAAAQARDALASEMTGGEVAEAQRLSAAFVPRKESQATEKGRDIFNTGVGHFERPKATGTGFFITEDGYLITSQHVAGNGAQVRLVTAAGLIAAEVVKVDAANDLALLRAVGKFTPLAVATSRAARLGSTVATIGFPNIGLQGFAPKFAKGEIASLSGASDDPRYFQISVPVQPGNSGGALVDERGNVVGVVSAKLSTRAALVAGGALPENVNYAVKSSFLLSFLESVPEVSAKLKEPNVKEQKFEDMVKSAEHAAVLVLVY